MRKFLIFAVILIGSLSLKSCVEPEVLSEPQNENLEFYEIENDSIPGPEWGGNGTGTGGGN
jgi:hypothetical protein